MMHIALRLAELYILQDGCWDGSCGSFHGGGRAGSLARLPARAAGILCS